MNIENENNILQYIANTNYAELLIFYQNLHINNNNLSSNIIIPKIQSYLQNNKNEKKKTLFLKDYIKLKINFLDENQQEKFLNNIKLIKNNINHDSYIKPIEHRINESKKQINNLQKNMRIILKQNKEFDKLFNKIKKLQKQKEKINHENKSKYREINKTKGYHFNTKLKNLKELKTQLKLNESNLKSVINNIKIQKEEYTNEYKNELLIDINNEINKLILSKNNNINQSTNLNENVNKYESNLKYYKVISTNTLGSYNPPNKSKKYNLNKNEDKDLLKIVTNLLIKDKSFNQQKVTWQLRNYKWDKDYFIADTNWDGWCGYHSIVRYAKIHNLNLHEGFNNYKNEPNTGDMLVAWYIKSLQKISDEQFNEIFGIIYSENGKLFSRKYIIQMLQGGKSNSRSWLDSSHLFILSYLLNVHFEVHTDSTGTYRIITNSNEETRPVIQLVHMDRNTHYNFLINKAKFRDVLIHN